MDVFSKQSSERLDYDIDFNDFFGPDDIDGFDNATVVTAAVDIVGAGHLVVDVPPIKIGSPARVVKVWLSGGINGKTYKVTVTATESSEGRIVEQDFKVKVKDL